MCSGSSTTPRAGPRNSSSDFGMRRRNFSRYSAMSSASDEPMLQAAMGCTAGAVRRAGSADRGRKGGGRSDRGAPDALPPAVDRAAAHGLVRPTGCAVGGELRMKVLRVGDRVRFDGGCRQVAGSTGCGCAWPRPLPARVSWPRCGTSPSGRFTCTNVTTPPKPPAGQHDGQNTRSASSDSHHDVGTALLADHCMRSGPGMVCAVLSRRRDRRSLGRACEGIRVPRRSGVGRRSDVECRIVCTGETWRTQFEDQGDGR